MQKTKLSSQTTRRIILNSQLLNGHNILPAGKDGSMTVIEKLGYVQIDTIAVINRAHHHSLWVRQPEYNEAMLHDLQSTDRKIFEYWGHAMAYLPMNDFRFYMPKMKNFENPSGKWTKDRLEKCEPLFPVILERIRKEGPLSAKDFESPDDKKGGTWWDWKPAKMALELLFWRGELMVSERRKFQKYYDLRERVLPSEVDTRMPDKSELSHFLVRRALDALGVVSERELQKFLQPGASRDGDMQVAGKRRLKQALLELIETGDVVALEIEADSTTDYFVFKSALEQSDNAATNETSVHILSPFDNLIIQRERMKSLFGFEYTLECYVPAAKRKYGYFVLPVLWGEKFVARFDAKAERKSKMLRVHKLIFEPEFTAYDEFVPVFVEKINAFAKFNRCEEVVIDTVVPKRNLAGLFKN
ncbi:MAG: winged helix-turn-helix domain-containing protein [Calditrichaeota bacterium]|nr:MAG: winged helix-turn-helix domain-containing protein [Calditrichota bacterium]